MHIDESLDLQHDFVWHVIVLSIAIILPLLAMCRCRKPLRTKAHVAVAPDTDDDSDQLSEHDSAPVELSHDYPEDPVPCSCERCRTLQDEEDAKAKRDDAWQIIQSLEKRVQQKSKRPDARTIMLLSKARATFDSLQARYVQACRDTDRANSQKNALGYKQKPKLKKKKARRIKADHGTREGYPEQSADDGFGALRKRNAAKTEAVLASIAAREGPRVKCNSDSRKPPGENYDTHHDHHSRGHTQDLQGGGSSIKRSGLEQCDSQKGEVVGQGTFSSA